MVGEGMKGSRAATAAEREKIRELTLQCVPQKQIMAETTLCRATVWKVQRDLQLPQRQTQRLPETTKKRIVSLLQKGWAKHRIARRLGLSEHKIQAFAPRGTPGRRVFLSPQELTAIRRMIRESEEQIAKQFGVSRAWVRLFKLKKSRRRDQ
jgi:hypothetical protein